MSAKKTTWTLDDDMRCAHAKLIKEYGADVVPPYVDGKTLADQIERIFPKLHPLFEDAPRPKVQ